MRRAGFVLVGGKSSRMGRDKALLPYRERTLAEAVATVLATSAVPVSLIGDPAKYSQLGFPVYPDLHPGLGPLSGLQTALTLQIAEWNLVIACDLPHISACILTQLWNVTASANPDQGCVVPITADGRLQPLCAVYHASCLSRINEAISSKRLKMMDLLTRLNCLTVPQPDSAAFLSANTPQDWAALQSVPA